MKTATAPLPPLRSVKVLDQLRERIRYLHYSLRTEQAYVNRVRAFIRFHVCVTRNLGQQRGISVRLANERKVSVSTHRQALAALLFFYGKVLCTDLPWLQEIGRPRPSRRLPVVLMDGGSHPRFSGRRSIVCSPSFCMERACGSVRVCNCGSRIWISITARSSCGRARAPGSGLDVTGELAPSLREQLSRARAWWLKDQAEAAAALRFPTPLSGSIRAPGIPGRGSGLLRSTRIRPIHGAVSCVAITCMTRPFSAPSNVP